MRLKGSTGDRRDLDALVEPRHGRRTAEAIRCGKEPMTAGPYCGRRSGGSITISTKPTAQILCHFIPITTCDHCS
jgi:hypothetical protein